MSKQLELFIHFFKRGVISLCLCLVTLLSLNACTDRTADTSFDYELSQQAFQSESESPLTLQIQGNNLEFAIVFKGGGGSYDEARLERSEDKMQIILFDTDGKLQNMWVIYQLSGSISSLDPGKYTFQVENEDGRLIAEDVFTIQ